MGGAYMSIVIDFDNDLPHNLCEAIILTNAESPDILFRFILLK